MRPLLVLCALICAISATTRGLPGPVVVQVNSYKDLHEAVIQGSPQRVRVLLEDHGLDPTRCRSLLIRKATMHRDTECLEVLLADPRVDPDAKDGWRLCHAAYNGLAARLSALLKNGADPTVGDNVAIENAALNGKEACVELLLADTRVDPGHDQNVTLSRAASRGHVKCVKLLLAHPKVNPADKNNAALEGAALEGQVECAKLLLADPRVSPEVVNFSLYHRKGLSFIIHIVEYQGKDLEALRKADLTILSADELAILIGRKRSDPDIQKHLVGAYLPHLADPETLKAIPGLDKVVMAAVSRGLWWPDELREIIKTFMNCREILHFVYY